MRAASASIRGTALQCAHRKRVTLMPNSALST
jgi:hypothetical protein